MRVSAPFLAVAIAALFGGEPLRAADATPQGARDLATVLERYAGGPSVGLPKTVTVTPDGEGYRVTLDPAGLLGLFRHGDAALRFPAFTIRAAPQPDGLWRVSDVSAAGPLQYEVQGQRWTSRTEGSRFEGLFDPALSAFRSWTFEADRYAAAGATPNGPFATEYAQPRQQQTSTGSAESLGVDLNASAKDFRYALALPKQLGDGGRVEVAAGALSATVKSEALRNRPLLDVWAFMVAHHTRADLTAHQDDLRAVLRAALPLWNSLGETFGLEGLHGVTPAGAFEIAAVRGLVAVSGARADGAYSFGLSYDGLKLPPGVAPDWASDLLPTSMALAPAITGMNFDAAARLALDRFDLRRPQAWTSDDGVAIGDALFERPLRLLLNGARVTSATYSLALDGEGSFNASAQDLPTMHAAVKMSGLNATIAKLTSAPAGSTVLGAAVGVLLTAKGLGRGDPDGEMTWDVVLGPDGQVRVNETPVGPPLKQSR